MNGAFFCKCTSIPAVCLIPPVMRKTLPATQCQFLFERAGFLRAKTTFQRWEPSRFKFKVAANAVCLFFASMLPAKNMEPYTLKLQTHHVALGE